MVMNTETQAIAVLVVEDDAADRRLIKLLLAQSSGTVGFNVEMVETLREAAERLTDNDYGVVLLDLGLADSNGLDTLRRVRSANPRIPIVVLTGLSDEENGLEAIKEGAEDYLIKGPSLGYALTRTVRYAIERGQMRENLQRSHDVQRTLNQVLNVAMQNSSLQEMFEQTIDHLASSSWPGLERRGAIFLVETDPDRLVMRAQCGLPPAVVEACGQVPLGQCICGEAAAEPADSALSVMERQECRCNGESACRHYLVPILSGGARLGVLKLFAAKQHRCGSRDEQFFRSIADILGTAVKRKHAEEMQMKLLAELEHANRELWDFVHAVSHDLKRPLSLLKTLADYLVDDYGDEVDENGRMQLNQLQGRVTRMNDSIDGMLRSSRIGRPREEMTQVDLHELVPEVISMLAPPENLTIKVRDRLPVVKCELTRIAQVLQNLLSSAIKRIDKPHGHIELTCEASEGFWRFGISDNGPAMEKARLERLFQLSPAPAMHNSPEGEGVSLPLVKRIVESYGGRIWVESEAGEGSTFFFTLPKQEVEVNRANVEAHTVR